MSYIYQLLIIIIAFAMILFIYFKWGTSEIKAIQSSKNIAIHRTIERLYSITNEICSVYKIFPSYIIKESNTTTYTEKDLDKFNTGIIYIVIWDEINDKVFSFNTLVYSILHEIAHIISPSTHHTDTFDRIEKKLLSIATSLNYYNSNIKIEEQYVNMNLKH